MSVACVVLSAVAAYVLFFVLACIGHETETCPSCRAVSVGRVRFEHVALR